MIKDNRNRIAHYLLIRQIESQKENKNELM